MYHNKHLLCKVLSSELRRWKGRHWKKCICDLSHNNDFKPIKMNKPQNGKTGDASYNLLGKKNPQTNVLQAYF